MGPDATAHVPVIHTSLANAQPLLQPDARLALQA